MRVCNVCRATEGLHVVDIIDKSDGGQRDGGVFLWLNGDLCEPCRTAIQNADFEGLSNRQKNR